MIIERHIPCEECGSSDARCVYDDGHSYCFSMGCPRPFIPAKGKEYLTDEYTYEYLPWRGVEASTFRFYDVKTKIDHEGKPISLGYRYSNGAYKVRNLEKKDFYAQGDIGKAGLFGKDKFAAGSHKYVTITEGELDALSLYQVLHGPVVSVQSSSTAARDCIADREWLAAYERVYLAFDNDAAGREALRSVAKLFDYNKIYVVKFTNRKDANEYLENGEGEELRRLWWNSRKYLPETIVSTLGEFRQILSEPKKVGVPYPFPTLTKMTYGIRTGETVLITAQEKVGKTSLMHHIEHHLLKETDDAVAAIFLEEPKQRHLQALAGLELRRPVHLPDCLSTDGEILSALEAVVRQDDRLHIYSHFGSDDPNVLLETIRFLVAARSCKYVLFDHLTMAVSGLAGEDERRALDHISTRLEMMVKELDFSLIMVSHVNDEGKTRGSRYPTKVADTTINLARDTSTADANERLRLHLSIPFQRFNHQSGPAGVLRFDPETYTYTEEAVNDNGLG